MVLAGFSHRVSFLISTFLIVLAASPLHATPEGVDDFDDGTLQNWRIGRTDPETPVVLLDAGRNGAGDHALGILSRGGGGIGSRLAVLNRDQWTGDFTAAGIRFVRCDLKNTGETTVVIRVAFDGNGGRFVSSRSFTLVPGGDWQTVTFPVEAGDLEAVGGTNVENTLADVQEFRFLHAPTPVFKAPSMAASLAIDNIEALAPPQVEVPFLGIPGLLALAGLLTVVGLAVLLRGRSAAAPA